MYCPTCGKKTQVKETRFSASLITRRRRFCACGNRFTTFETLSNPRIPAGGITSTSATNRTIYLSL